MSYNSQHRPRGLGLFCCGSARIAPAPEEKAPLPLRRSVKKEIKIESGVTASVAPDNSVTVYYANGRAPYHFNMPAQFKNYQFNIEILKSSETTHCIMLMTEPDDIIIRLDYKNRAHQYIKFFHRLGNGVYEFIPNQGEVFSQDTDGEIMPGFYHPPVRRPLAELQKSQKKRLWCW